MKKLIISPSDINEAPTKATLFAIIEKSGLAVNTQRKYKAALQRYLDTGQQITDTESLADYAATLSPASQSHLKSAVNMWAKQTITLLKAQVTPETVDATQAIIWRLESLTAVIKPQKTSGESAHIWLTLLEQEKILSAIDPTTPKGQRDNVLLRLMLGTGLRRSEAALIEFDRIKMMGHVPALDMRGKGQRKRVIPIGHKLNALLLDWRDVPGVGPGRILRSVNQRGQISQSLTDVSIFRIVRNYGHHINRPDLAPHDLRRTFAENLRRHTDIITISTLLGHQDVKTTMRYLNTKVDLSVIAADYLPW